MNEVIDYSHLLIKQYEHWKLQIFANQEYLGRCVVWCDRESALDYTEMTQTEQMELLSIMSEWREATTSLFATDWHNYAFLGNETRHLHGHLVPRYKRSRELFGLRFEDKLWGKNYRTDKSFVTPTDILENVQDQIREYLS